MTDKQAVERRHSRRSFLGGVNGAPLGRLLVATEAIRQESGLTVRLESDGGNLFEGFKKSYGRFDGVETFWLLAGNAADPHLDEKAGYYGEILVLEATRLGLGTCWVGGTFDHTMAQKLAGPKNRVVALIPVGPVASGRRLKEGLIYTLSHKKNKPIRDMAEWDDAPPRWFWRGMDLVRRAPSAYSRQPVRVRWQDGAAMAYVQDNEPMQLIDLGIAKLHFELGAGGWFDLGNGGRFLKHAATPAEIRLSP